MKTFRFCTLSETKPETPLEMLTTQLPTPSISPRKKGVSGVTPIRRYTKLGHMEYTISEPISLRKDAVPNVAITPSSEGGVGESSDTGLHLAYFVCRYTDTNLPKKSSYQPRTSFGRNKLEVYVWLKSGCRARSRN